MCGCEESQPVVGAVSSQETTEQAGAQQNTGETTEQADAAVMPDVDDEIEQILDSSTKEFIGGYTVDEAFLYWVYAQYGEDTIRQLDEALLAGTATVDLWYELTGNSIHVLWLTYCQQIGFQQYQLDNVYWKECATDNQVVLDFTGDINLAEGWSTTEYMDSQPNGIYDCFSADLLTEMQSADIMMINNEFTYSNRGTALEGKAYTFRAKPERVKNLEAFGTDIANLANNHVCDFGNDAILDTFDTLVQEGIPYVGAGRDLDEADDPVYFVANGRKIAIVAATQIERSLNYTKEATENTPGVLKTLNPDKFVTEIAQAKKQSDIVIVFVHWGTEGTDQYGSDQVALAEAFVGAGADAIIGGHTHCLQGMTYMEDVPIIYSLGNFWFSQTTLDTGLSQLVIKEDGSIRFRFIPCIQSGMVTRLVTEETEKNRIFDYMESISTGITIDEDGYVTDAE